MVPAVMVPMVVAKLEEMPPPLHRFKLCSIDTLHSAEGGGISLQLCITRDAGQAAATRC